MNNLRSAVTYSPPKVGGVPRRGGGSMYYLVWQYYLCGSSYAPVTT